MRLTRREAIWAGMGVCGWAREAWEDKAPAEWSATEIEQILTKSAWTREAQVAYDSHQSGPLGGEPRGEGRHGRGGQGRSGGALGGEFKTRVRWESALPVRAAMKRERTEDDAENYVLNMIGDVPGVGLPAEEDDAAERKQKFEMLRDTTRVERRDEPLHLEKVEATRGGTLFYFSRVFAIKPGDKQVTFVTKMGPLEVKCKFVLGEMVYRGMLEL